MSGLTRRGAIGLGVLAGSALWPGRGWAGAAGDEKVIAAGEKAVLFKVKDVTVERVDRDGRTISASLGNRDRPTKLTDLPLGKDVRVRASNVFPGGANNLPFSWERLEELVGKRVSLTLRAEAGGLSVDSVATNND
jgi:hypothetical protein